VRPIAVTGWAWRTPLGSDVDEVGSRLARGERAAAPLARFPTEGYACRWAAAISGDPAPSRHQRFLRRMGGFALEVALEAARAAPAACRGERLGLFFGYGGLRAHWNDMMPALARQAPDGARAWERGLHLLHPFWMLQHLSNNAHALAAAELGARGDGLLLAGANAGAQALAAAERALACRAIDAAVVAAYDTLLEPETLIELAARGAFTGRLDQAPPAPYDERPAGFVPGEAAAAVVLERADDAGERSLALVQAWDGADGGRAAAGGLDAAANVLASLPAANAGRPAIGVVDGAGLADVTADDEERRLLAARGDLVSASTPICATLAAMGQLGAAAAVVQAIALAVALRAGRLPPVAALDRGAPGPLRPLGTAEPTQARAGLALSAGAPGLAGAVRVELP
jgi:3-oxoacyl-[acyl-carrier-protein] synthase II